MPKLLDFLTFKDTRPVAERPITRLDETLRKEERDAAVLTDKYPHDGADIETASEYRLASLLQYPHY
jgi:hypothetical protein